MGLLLVGWVRTEYAQVLRMLGNGRLEAYCFDGVKRLCHIRGKMRKKVRAYWVLGPVWKNGLSLEGSRDWGGRIVLAAKRGLTRVFWMELGSLCLVGAAVLLPVDTLCGGMGLFVC